tara:strand:+ start:83 stop:1276 length:1194 start_codon:yes stop_codon:yes gene_type:complete
MSGPLHGFRIVDVTSMVSGPAATMLLADQGADVIKVENPKGGDHTRASANTQNGFSANFLNNNRNKRSVTLNLKNKHAKKALLRICESADVFVQNFRPGVANRMGIGEKDIRAVSPNIIYVSICGFGESGPLAAKPVYDPLIQALSGLTTVQAGSDDARPRLVRTILPDKLTGTISAQAITAALLARTRTGKGQHVKISMLDVIMAFLWGSDMGSQTLIDEPVQQQHVASFVDLIYETADGYISVAVQSNREWEALVRAFNKPKWLKDPRFKTPALRQQNIDERLNLTQEILKTRPTKEWLSILEAEDVPSAPVLTRSEAIFHPQVIANDVILESKHPRAGRIRQALPAAKFSLTHLDFRLAAPTLGEHTTLVLREAGLTQEQIAFIKEKNEDSEND